MKAIFFIAICVILLPLAAVTGFLVMIIKGKTPARVAGAILLAIFVGVVAHNAGWAMAIHSENGRFNYNIGWASEWLFERLRVLADQQQHDAIQQALVRLDEEANLFPMYNRDQSPFHDLVQEILADTSNLLSKAKQTTPNKALEGTR